MLVFVRTFSKTIFIFLIPLALSPILFLGTKDTACIFCIALFTLYWLTEVVPLAITSLLPLLLFPVLGIIPAKELAQQYMKDTSMMLLITLIAAIAVEECQLHRRIALNVLVRTGGRFHWTLLAYAFVTCFVSLWLSDSATTALMLPIAVAALEAMDVREEDQLHTKNTDTDVSDPHFDYPKRPYEASSSNSNRGMWKALVLVCSHASLIGGTGVITSTAPNLIFKDAIETRYHEDHLKMSFLAWMAFAIPPAVGYLLASWIVLQIVFLGPRSLLDIFRRSTNDEIGKISNMQKEIFKMHKSLGPMTFAEISVLLLYGTMIAAWMFRDPGFVDGWASFIDPERSRMLSDTCIGILIVFAFFAWPRERPDLLCWRSDISKAPTRRRPILTWEIVHRKLPWSVLFLIGAGFAISKGVQESGLSHKMTCLVLSKMDGTSVLGMQAILTTAITFFTEMMSNGATASIFIPIALTIAESLKLHPFYLAIPAAIAPSFAFCFPMATPPNAIVYETGVLKMWEMAATGIFLNFLCIGITVVNTNTWAYWLFDMSHVSEHVAVGNSSLYC
ncbi:hypothetical protein L596_027327 [Steinernema carpocapsae]|uniref:Citrate transporter-like domain-containing protein n=1 Tax=Steinernema carpocapsae TaxID=34508 RepID=A0A4U5M408_STECR|nr:hypothetical protein L596_027327 [Steinernema carpocapsae]